MSPAAQQGVEYLTGQAVLIQPKAISVIAAADLTYAPPPPMLAPPPPPLTGRQITATFRISKCAPLVGRGRVRGVGARLGSPCMSTHARLSALGHSPCSS